MTQDFAVSSMPGWNFRLAHWPQVRVCLSAHPTLCSNACTSLHNTPSQNKDIYIYLYFPLFSSSSHLFVWWSVLSQPSAAPKTHTELANCKSMSALQHKFTGQWSSENKSVHPNYSTLGFPNQAIKCPSKGADMFQTQKTMPASLSHA